MLKWLAFSAALLLPGAAGAGSLAPREGWAVHETAIPYAEMSSRVADAVKAEGLIVVTKAGPTGAARARGIDIPGNLVMGVFNNDFAVRVLELSVAAMIEAPIRFYLTENEDGTATLSYKTPSHVFAPYAEEGGAALAAIAAELDAKFAAIAAAATAE